MRLLGPSAEHEACAKYHAGVSMVLSRGAKTLGACSAVLLAGILGLTWWLWRPRRGREPPVARLRRTRAALVALGLLVIAVGATWRLVIVIKPVGWSSMRRGTGRNG